MTKPENFFSGNGQPMEAIDSINVYGALPDRGDNELSAFDDTYPMALYGHYREDRSKEFYALRWATTLVANQALVIIQNFAHRPGATEQEYYLEADPMPEGSGVIDLRSGQVSSEIQQQWGLNESITWLGVETAGATLNWLRNCSEADGPFEGLGFRTAVQDGISHDDLKRIVVDTITPEHRDTAGQYFDTFHSIFTKYAELTRS